MGVSFSIYDLCSYIAFLLPAFVPATGSFNLLFDLATMGVKARDVHKLFKQALVSRRYLTEDLARVLWKKCEEAARSEFMNSV